MTRKKRTRIVISLFAGALVIAAVWAYLRHNTVDRKVERLLDVVRRLGLLGQAPGIVDRTLIKLGLEEEPPQLEGSLGGSIMRMLEDRSMKEDEVSRALIALGTPAIPRLIEALNDEDPFVPEYAAYALGRIGDPAAVGGLLAALHTRPVDVLERQLNTELIVALGRIGGPRATEKLILLLQSEDSTDQFFAAKTLGKIGDPRAIEALIESLGKDIYWPGWRHLYSLDVPGQQLCRIGQPAVEPLIRALQERGEEVPLFQIALILNKIGDERAKAALQAALAKKSDEFRTMVEAVMKGQLPPSEGPFISYPDGETPFVSYPDGATTAPAAGE